MRPADKPGAALARLKWAKMTPADRLAVGAMLAEARRKARERRIAAGLQVSREAVTREILPVTRETEPDAEALMGHARGCPCGLCHYGREWLRKQRS